MRGVGREGGYRKGTKDETLDDRKSCDMELASLPSSFIVDLCDGTNRRPYRAGVIRIEDLLDESKEL